MSIAPGFQEAYDLALAPPQHRTYHVEEWGYVDVAAEDILHGGRIDVYSSVTDKDYFTIRPKRGTLTLQALGFIGVIPLNDRVTIVVTPRVPVRNLSRLLRIAEHLPVIIDDSARWYEHEGEMYPSLVDLYARALTDRVEELPLRGLIREYVRRDEYTSFPRGRILIGETAKSLRPRGISHKVAASWYQRTVDNAPNRCIKYALWFLARHRSDLARDQTLKQSRVVLQALNRAYRVFDGVELDLGLGFMRDPTVTGAQPLPRLRAYYRPVLDLCLAIIRQQAISLDRDSGDLGLPSLVVNMSTLFEAYVRNVLTVGAIEHAWDASVLNGNHKSPGGGEKALFHTGADTKANPDIVVAHGSEAERGYPVLLEIKYKPSHRSISRDDLNQAISYGVSYRCRRVVLVYPRGEAASDADLGLHELGTIDNMVVDKYVFDLAADDLPAHEDQFVQAIGELATSGSG